MFYVCVCVSIVFSSETWNTPGMINNTDISKKLSCLHDLFTAVYQEIFYYNIMSI